MSCSLRTVGLLTHRRRIPRGAGHLSFTRFGYDNGRMDSDYDPEREAEAAVRLAAATDGLERQRWIGLATAWQELARMRAPSRPGAEEAVCTENLIRVDDVTESPKLAE
jgi:hypothetical protein